MKRVLITTALLALCMGLCGVAEADTVTDTGVLFTGTVTGTTVTLTIQCVDTTKCSGSWFVGDVTLKGFTFSGSPTLGSAPAGFIDPVDMVKNGGQDNKGVGNGGGCNGTQTGNAVCWDAKLPLGTQLGTTPLTFTANITGGSASGLHVQATFYNNSAGNQTGGGKVLAVSDDLTAGPPTKTPEPASLMLLGLGLLGAPLLRRKK